MTDRIAYVLGLFLLAVGVSLSACTDTKPTIPANQIVVTGCDYFRPITASAKDTSDTKTQIIAHNYAYQLACKDKTP